MLKKLYLNKNGLVKKQPRSATDFCFGNRRPGHSQDCNFSVRLPPSDSSRRAGPSQHRTPNLRFGVDLFSGRQTPLAAAATPVPHNVEHRICGQGSTPLKFSKQYFGDEFAWAPSCAGGRRHPGPSEC